MSQWGNSFWDGVEVDAGWFRTYYLTPTDADRFLAELNMRKDG